MVTTVRSRLRQRSTCHLVPWWWWWCLGQAAAHMESLSNNSHGLCLMSMSPGAVKCSLIPVAWAASFIRVWVNDPGAAEAILIRMAFAVTWDYEDNQVWVTAKDHVWVHGPTTAEVYVDSHVKGSHERSHEAWDLGCNLWPHWCMGPYFYQSHPNIRCQSYHLELGCQPGCLRPCLGLCPNRRQGLCWSLWPRLPLGPI